MALQRGRGPLPTIPGVQSLSLAIRYLPGGRASFLEYVQAATIDGDATARAWYAVYASLSNYEQARVSFDDVCAASGVGVSNLLRAIVGSAVDAHTDVGNLMAAVFHPKVVHAAGKSALRIGGKYADIALKDRQSLLTHAGFLPAPKGSVTRVEVNANAASSSSAAAAAAAVNPSVPSFQDDMRALQAAKERVQKELADIPLPDAQPIDVEPVDDDDEDDDV
jgi:hypothetical protein